MNQPNWRQRRVLVVGIGRSGYDAARVLHKLGAEVAACDAGEPALARDLASIGVQLFTHWRGSLPAKNYDLLITSPGIPAQNPILQEAVGQGIPIWSEVELAYRLSRAPIIAVTGTNGKSTTVSLIAHLLSTSGYRAIPCANIAAEGMERTLTDAASQAGPDDILVAEVSSFQLEWVHEFRPHVGVWTTLSEDHLDRHGSMQEYGRVKARLFRCQTETDFAVLPGDDSLVLSFVQTRAKYIYFSHQNIDRNGVFSVYCLPEGVVVKSRAGEYRLASIARYRLLGEHNRRNLAAAVGACLPWGVSGTHLEQAIATYEPLPHRMEWVAEVGGVQYVNNSMCTNLQALEESLKSVPAPVVPIMGGVDKSGTPYGKLVPLLQGKARGVILIGADAEKIEGQLRSAGWSMIVRCSSLEEAVLQARRLAQPGDWVILCPGGASFDMFTDFQERGRAFRAVVRRLEGRDE